MKEIVEKQNSWLKLWTVFQRGFLITVCVLAPICCIWATIAHWILDHGTKNWSIEGGYIDNMIKILYPIFPIHLISSLIFLMISVLILVLILWMNRIKHENRYVMSIIVFVLFTATIYNFLFIDILKTKYEDVGNHVAELFKKIPVNTELHSVGPASFPFLYYYMFHTGKILPQIESPKLTTGQYFCIPEDEYFLWNPDNVEIIASFNTSRFKSGYSKEQNSPIIIGKIIVPNNLNQIQEETFQTNSELNSE
jgi:hypothetical protein